MFSAATRAYFDQLPELPGLNAADARRLLSAAYADVLAARDAPASDRVLVAAPVRLVRQVARVCAWAHLALIADGNASHSDAEELLPLGVEVVAGDVEQIESSLAARPYHYDVVILASPSHPLGPLIRATQPQASRIVDPPRSDDALADVLADVGVDATRATDRAP